MKRGYQCLIAGWLLCLLTMACQGPAPTVLQAAPAPVASLASEAAKLAQARSYLRPGTRDRIEPILDAQQRPISWMIVYDPPLPSPGQNTADGLETKSYIAFGDLFANKYGNVSTCRVASILRPENISLERYRNWYGKLVSEYGGRRAHPDPWINTEGCQPEYKVYIDGRESLVIPESRYAAINAPNLNTRDPFYGLSQENPFFTVKIPCDFVPRTGAMQVSFHKNSACDRTSPGFTKNIVLTNFLPSGSYSDEYCQRSLQTEHLDVQERRIWELDVIVAELEAQVAVNSLLNPEAEPVATADPNDSGADSAQGFETQALDHFAIASSNPSSSPDPTPTPESEPDPAGTIDPNAKIARGVVSHQRERLQSKLSALKSRTAALKTIYERVEGDDDFRDEMLYVAEQLETSFEPVSKDLSWVDAYEELLCPPDKKPETAPSLAMLYAGFQPDGSIVIQGRVNHPDVSVNLNDLRVDFLGAIEVLETPVIQDEGEGFFKLVLPNVKMTDTFRQALGYGSQNELTIPEVNLRLGFENFQTQQVTTPVRIPVPPIKGRLTPKLVPIPPITSNQRLSEDHRLMLEMGIFFSDIYLDGERVATCDGDQQRCKAILESLGYDIATLKKRDSVAAQYFRENAIRNGGWLIDEHTRPALTTLALPGKPLVIPPAQVNPPATHHMLVRFIDRAIAGQPNNHEKSYRQSSVHEALTRWHLEPVFRELDHTIRLGGFKFGNVESDNLIYVTTGGPDENNNIPIKVLGDIESKLTSTPAKITRSLYYRYRQLRALKDNKTTITINGTKHFISEIVGLENYMFIAVRTKDQTPLTPQYSPKTQLLIIPDPSRDIGDLNLKFSELQALYPILFLRIVETREMVDSLAEEYKKIRGL